MTLRKSGDTNNPLAVSADWINRKVQWVIANAFSKLLESNMYKYIAD